MKPTQAIKAVLKSAIFMEVSENGVKLATPHYFVVLRGMNVAFLSEILKRDLSKERGTFRMDSAIIAPHDDTPIERLIPKNLEGFEVLTDTGLAQTMRNKKNNQVFAAIFHGEVAGFYVGLNNEYLEIIESLVNPNQYLCKEPNSLCLFADIDKVSIVAGCMPMRLSDNKYLVVPPSIIPKVENK